MQDNWTLKIDPESRDIVLDDDGVMESITGDETSAQAVRLTLQTWQGEFPFDLTHGTAYDRIMGKKPKDLTEDEIPEVIRAAVFQEKNVEEVEAVTYEKTGRSLEVAVSGRLADGNPITVEVSTN